MFRDAVMVIKGSQLIKYQDDKMELQSIDRQKLGA